MVLRSLCSLVAAMIVGYAVPAKAYGQDIGNNTKPVITSTASTKPFEDNLIFLGPKVKARAQNLDLSVKPDPANSCPYPSLILEPEQPFPFELVASPNFLETGINSEDKKSSDHYQRLVLEIVSPNISCLPKAAANFTDLTSQTTEISLFPDYGDWQNKTGSSTMEIRLELPGDLRYVLLGSDHNNIIYERGGLAYDLKDKRIRLHTGEGNLSRHLPQLSLERLAIGSMNWPAFTDAILGKGTDSLRLATNHLGNSLETLANQVVTNLNLSDETGDLNARAIELTLKLRGIFEQVLPQYVSNDGVVDPEEWSKIQETIEGKIKEFEARELKTEEREGITSAINGFREEFQSLQKEHPILANIWSIYGSADPAALISWDGITLRNLITFFAALDPDLYTLTVEDNKLGFKTNRLNSTLVGQSSNYTEFTDGINRTFIETAAGRLAMEAAGDISLTAALSEGLEIEEIVPEKYQNSYGLLKLILGIDPKLVNMTLNGEAHFASRLHAERMRGFSMRWNKNKLSLGLNISFGSLYGNYANGQAQVAGSADSQNDLISAYFMGGLQIEQVLGSKQTISLNLDKMNNVFWFNLQLGMDLEQARRLRESWLAGGVFKADYRGNISQNAYYLAHSKDITTNNTLNPLAGLRVGRTLGLVDILAFTDLRELGLGAILASPRISALAECAFINYCQLTARIALDREFNPKNERNHFLRLQQLANTHLAGVEAIIAGENHYHTLANPGLHLELQAYRALVSQFPYLTPSKAKLSLVMVEPDSVDSLNLYFALGYDGNFDSVNGGLINLGSRYWQSFFGYTATKDQLRNSNSQYGTAGLTVHTKPIDILTRAELYPDPLDEEPEVKSSTKVDPNTQQKIETYSLKHEGEFRMLVEIRAPPGFLDELLTAIPRPELRLLQVTAEKSLLLLEGINGGLTSDFTFGRLSLHQQVGTTYSDARGTSFDWEGEAIYRLINGEIGPALTISKQWSPENNSHRLSPGLGWQAANKGHYLNLLVTGIPPQFSLRYIYDPKTAELAPYVKAGLSNSQGLLELGVRTGPMIFTTEVGFIPKGKQDLEFTLGLKTTVDLTSF